MLTQLSFGPTYMIGNFPQTLKVSSCEPIHYSLKTLGISRGLCEIARTNLLGGPGMVENALAAAACSVGDTGDSDGAAEAAAASEDGWEDVVITV